MYRGCRFEYANVNSEDFNLSLAYVDNANDKFDSGGLYEPITDSIPRSAEELLYGLNYNEEPLEFEIEILNLDDAIPFEQSIKIKNWLFGQDGWKTFRIMDENQEYYLKCLLIPKEDITDVSGLRGFRCKLKNNSGFWYKDYEVEFTNEFLNEHEVVNVASGVERIDSEFDIYVPEEAASAYKIMPKINFTIRASAFDNEDEAIPLAFTNYTNHSQIWSQMQLPLSNYFSSSDERSLSSLSYASFNSKLLMYDDFYISISDNDTEYMLPDSPYLPSMNYRDGLSYKIYLDNTVNPYALYLNAGLNHIRLRDHANFENVKMKYTVGYRVGAF